MESKFELLAPRQADKSRDKLLGQGIVTLFGKPADQENGGLMSQRTILSELEFRLLLYWSGREQIQTLPGSSQTPEGMC